LGLRRYRAGLQPRRGAAGGAAAWPQQAHQALIYWIFSRLSLIDSATLC